MQDKQTGHLPVFLGSLFLLSGCATQGGWSPTVDTYGDSRAEYITHDKVECQQLAQQTSGNPTEKAAVGGLAGGALGAATGAAIGAITGNAGKGAAIGGVAGGIGGGVHQASSANTQYKTAYINCMGNRGHKVIN
ncbi:MAG: hypothetical protein U9P00_03560 [Pseudomonadota bacterium]|nr:hypothetical protein [Pseudomonadota bacterium]